MNTFFTQYMKFDCRKNLFSFHSKVEHLVEDDHLQYKDEDSAYTQFKGVAVFTSHPGELSEERLCC